MARAAQDESAKLAYARALRRHVLWFPVAHQMPRRSRARLAGLSERFRLHLATIETLHHIRQVTGGYKVTIQRRGETFEKTVGGSSSRSLEKAMRLRDDALALLRPGAFTRPK
jgi:hypothetical protein